MKLQGLFIYLLYNKDQLTNFDKLQGPSYNLHFFRYLLRDL